MAPPTTVHTHTMRVLAFVLVSLLTAGCGGRVVFDGDDGGGGASEEYECVLGACGEACTKCSGDDCFNGSCDPEGRCVAPDEPIVCDDR